MTPDGEPPPGDEAPDFTGFPEHTGRRPDTPDPMLFPSVLASPAYSAPSTPQTPRGVAHHISDDDEVVFVEDLLQRRLFRSALDGFVVVESPGAACSRGVCHCTKSSARALRRFALG